MNTWYVTSAKAVGLSENRTSIYVRLTEDFCICVFPKANPYYRFGIFDRQGKTVATGVARTLSEAQRKSESLAAYAQQSHVIREKAG